MKYLRFKNCIALLLCTLLVLGCFAAPAAAATAPGIIGSPDDTAVTIDPAVDGIDPLEEGSFGTEVYVQVYPGVQIIGRTEDFSMPVGGNQQLLVAASGVMPFSYQWYRDGIAIPGATSRSYTITGAAQGSYVYTVRVTDSFPTGSTSAETDIYVIVNDDWAYRRIPKPETGIAVSAYMHRDTGVSSSVLEEGDALYEELLGHVPEGNLPFSAGQFQFTNGREGLSPPWYLPEAQLEIEVGNRYNGETVQVLYRAPDGTVTVLSGVVQNGVVTVAVEGPGAYMVVAPDDAIAHITARVEGAGGNITPKGRVAVLLGDERTFAVVPQSGYAVDTVLVDGSAAALTGNCYTFTNVQQDHSIVVSFRKVDVLERFYDFIVQCGPNGTANPLGTCTVQHGRSQTVYFLPDAGYAVDTVTVNGEVYRVFGNSYTFPAIEGHTTVQVNFKPNTDDPVPQVTRDVTVTSSAGGTVSPGGTVTVVRGGGMEFYFYPDAGYRLHSVTVNGVEVEVDGNFFYLANILEDTALHANFVPAGEENPNPSNRYTITPSAGEGGRISPDEPVRVAAHGSQTFYFHPANGYVVASVLVDGEVVAHSGENYVFQDVMADHTVHVNFRPATSSPTTGDEMARFVLWGLLLLAVAALCLLIILDLRRRKKDDEHGPGGPAPQEGASEAAERREDGK